MGSQEGCYLSCSVKRNQEWVIRQLREVTLINGHNLLPIFLAFRYLTKGGAISRMKDSIALWQVYMVMVTWISYKEIYGHLLWLPHTRTREVPNHKIKVNPEVWSIIMVAYGNQVINIILSQLWLIMGPRTQPNGHFSVPKCTMGRDILGICHNPHIGSLIFEIRPVRVGKPSGSSEPCNPLPTPNQNKKLKTKSHPSHRYGLKHAKVVSTIISLFNSSVWPLSKPGGC